MSGDADIRPTREPRPRRTGQDPFASLVADRVRAAQKPWWTEALPVFAACARVAAAPLNIAIKIAEGAVACAVLGVLVLGYAWYSGRISDKDVVAALKPVGQRILVMVQSGAPQ